MMEADQFVDEIIKKFVDQYPAGRLFAQLLKEKTGTDLKDWADFISIEGGLAQQKHLSDLGYVIDSVFAGKQAVVMKCPKTLLPRFVLRDQQYPEGVDERIELAIRCDSLSLFREKFHCHPPVRGTLGGYLAQCAFDPASGSNLLIVERRGCHNILPLEVSEYRLAEIKKVRELLAGRSRNELDVVRAMDNLMTLIQEAVVLVGPDITSALFLEIERNYWQSRNRAAQLHKDQQDEMGLGWANVHYHAFCSSRAHFFQLIKIFERVGFVCRERFHAKEEVDWGAQILAHPITGAIIFADVDLTSEEADGDFAHKPLTSLNQTGAIDLWCGLHGESVLDAGMHHAAIRYDFNKTSTAGERWEVNPLRLESLLSQGLITSSDYDKFLQQGAIGSHVEYL